ELREGGLEEATRHRLAVKAFARTAAYDAAIHAYLSGGEAAHGLRERLRLDLPRAQALRYGENPHQAAARYGRFLEIAEPLHGKELSYNNLVDVQAALALILDFDPDEEPAVAILKHNTPCGVGAGATPLEAWRRAFASDPDSPFGGIVVSSRPFDVAL